MFGLEDRLQELIKAQEEYIKFLGDNISKNAVYLEMHHMGCSAEDYKKGVDLRSKVEECKKNLE